MLNAANLAFVAFGHRHGSADGQAIVFFVMRWPRRKVRGAGHHRRHLPAPPPASPWTISA